MLDDEYIITTDEDFWAENYIKDGTDIDEDEWNKLVTKINLKKRLTSATICFQGATIPLRNSKQSFFVPSMKTVPTRQLKNARSRLS